MGCCYLSEFLFGLFFVLFFFGFLVFFHMFITVITKFITFINISVYYNLIFKFTLIFVSGIS